MTPSPQHTGTSSTEQNPPDGGLYPIRTVAKLTGVNPVTLRAWERRYGLLKPTRTAKGHRLYSQHDVDLIRRVIGLVAQGIPISQVDRHLAPPAMPAPADKAVDPWAIAHNRALKAIAGFDTASLDAVYSEALSLYPIEVVTQKLVIPILETLGGRWRTVPGVIAEEHFFGAYLRNKIGARFHHQTLRNTGPTLVTACLPGEHHEVGLLLFSLTALDHGYQLISLGANMPFSELAVAVNRCEADAVVLSGTGGSFDAQLENGLRELAEKVIVFVGGPFSDRYREKLTKAGIAALGSNIPTGLKELDTRLKLMTS